MSHPLMPESVAFAAAEQIMSRCDALAEISETAGQLTRVYLSAEHLRANALVGTWMREAGMRVWQDSVGNICGRYEGLAPDAPALLMGSHLDTVRNAGRYDGMLGVLTAIETVRFLHQQQIRLPVALEIVGFGDEEGTRFGITLLGSRGLTGAWPDNWLRCQDNQGVSVAQALDAAGFDAQAIAQAARPVSDIVGYLELHIEQGPCLEQADLALGVVTAINGARRLNCTFQGVAGHAGTVPMTQRQDALAAAANWMVQAETLTRESDPYLVATFGTLQCLPGAANVIPGEVRLTLDIRGPEDAPLDALLQRLLTSANEIARQRGCRFEAEEYYRIAATRCDPALQRQLSAAVTQIQGRSLLLPSGAGHDAIAIAERWPVAMLFVRCRGGVSHHPDESVMTEDVAQALRALYTMVRQSGAGAAG
ncbi:allantoate amidohydrolase [Brenneria izbisi]|uniref:Allantoate amidohydrolase n=1 Tax=Brenneria izbisi TaxID=2939450 RepID=A0AA42C262_9GAMM|nr:allantoate amidohydrolase [Brenneria izbisi]MCV9880447.1 allantoate amidohydrolase [Brenneria izbisi]MCV9883833.1 allantoate amidohydrolase [Brenneria izbisi]